MDSEDLYIYERIRHLANVAVWSVDLQVRRIREPEPEDAHFIFRRWVDYHFLIVALSRLRETAKQLLRIPSISEQMQTRIAHFDAAFPWLRDLRNVVAHFDEYPIGKGNNKGISKAGTEVAKLGPECLSWLGFEIRPAEALKESAELFQAIKDCGTAFSSAAVEEQK